MSKFLFKFNQNWSDRQELVSSGNFHEWTSEVFWKLLPQVFFVSNVLLLVNELLDCGNIKRGSCNSGCSTKCWFRRGKVWSQVPQFSIFTCHAMYTWAVSLFLVLCGVQIWCPPLQYLLICYSISTLLHLVCTIYCSRQSCPKSMTSTRYRIDQDVVGVRGIHSAVAW